MIYITETFDHETEMSFIKNVWDVPTNEAKELYKEFVMDEAQKRALLINIHFFNLMNKDYHPRMSDDEYKLAKKEWNKFLRQWNIDRFIAEKLKGRKLKFKTI